MFYLFLIITSFVEFYFFRLFNQICLRGASFSGDILFAIFGVVISFLFLQGTIHVKHLNREWLKKTSFIIAILAILYFLASCISFNFNYIVSSLEISIILIIDSYFLYKYETAPEGEPDIEDDNIDEELDSPFNLYESEYFNDDMAYSELEESIPVEEVYEDKNLSRLNNLVEEIQEKISSEEMDENLKTTCKLVGSVFNANSDYRDDNLNNLIFILTLYNDSLENKDNSNNIEQINNSLNLINTNLENIYYNTRGAQVFKTEQDVKALREKLEDSKNN